MNYIINLFLAVFFAYFSLQVFPELPNTGFWSILIFFFWYIILWLISFFYDRDGHFYVLPRVFGLSLFYIQELFLASLWVAYDVITPKERVKPGILAFPLRAKTDFEITLLANMITLTPGTLSIDVSEDRKILYIHDINIMNYDFEKKKEEIRNGFEQKILKITRGKDFEDEEKRNSVA